MEIHEHGKIPYPYHNLLSVSHTRIHTDQLDWYEESSAASTGSMHDGQVNERISQSSIQSLW